MAAEEWQTYCPQCKKVVLGRRDAPNHLLHFLVGIFTCGLWWIAWLFIVIAHSNNPFRCPICGTAGENS